MACVQKAGEEVKIYYFYSPTCPNCREVEPFISYLKNSTDVSFVVCNVKNFDSCSDESKSVAKSVYKKLGFFGVPTAVVEVKGNRTVFVGKYEVLRLSEFLERMGYKVERIEIKEKKYDVSECLNCHRERKIPPPSTFTCSYCCHFS